MLEPEVLSAEGLLYVCRDFYSPQECIAIQDAMRRARREGSKSYYSTAGHVLDTSFRSTQEAEVGPELRNALANRLRGFKEAMESYFKLEIKGLEPSQFLCYEPGDFFRPHIDEGKSRTGDRRLVSMLIFVNAPETHEPNPPAGLTGYRGGELVLYRPSRRPPHKLVGMPIKIAPGLLIAFRPDLMHGVQPVESGERHSIVSWLI
ncbi:MAG: hypothetical protein CVV27_04670 [Candidatus Melainabacteria bacterium HGW-Melainabacteria-1]|nr:MAG: hypothetical protein CVV27_04670 [Candidatus Melainabacteria bacterium HGW-Melainabacteria-1]